MAPTQQTRAGQGNKKRAQDPGLIRPLWRALLKEFVYQLWSQLKRLKKKAALSLLAPVSLTNNVIRWTGPVIKQSGISVLIKVRLQTALVSTNTPFWKSESGHGRLSWYETSGSDSGQFYKLPQMSLHFMTQTAFILQCFCSLFNHWFLSPNLLLITLRSRAPKHLTVKCKAFFALRRTWLV